MLQVQRVRNTSTNYFFTTSSDLFRLLGYLRSILRPPIFSPNLLTFCHILSSSSESLCSWTLSRLCYSSFIVIFFHFSFCSDVCWMYIAYRFHWHCFGTSRISYYIFRASPPFFVLQLSFYRHWELEGTLLIYYLHIMFILLTYCLSYLLLGTIILL